MPARREARTPYPFDVGDQGEGLGRQEAETHRFAGDPAYGAQDLVGRRGGEAVGESTSKGGDVGIPESAPVDRVGVGRAELDGDEGKGAAHGAAALRAGEAGEVGDDGIVGGIVDSGNCRQRRLLVGTVLEEGERGRGAHGVLDERGRL